MDLSDDFFDQPPVNQSRAGGKFQPRAKQKPRKGTSVSVPPTWPSDTKKEGVTQSLSNLDPVQPVQSIDVVDNGLINLKGSSVLATSVTVGHEESLTQNETRASDVPVSDIPMWRKDVDLDQDPFQDVANISPKDARAGGKLQPKAKCGPKKETSQPMLSTLQDVMEEKATKAASSGLELNEDQGVQPADVVDDSRNLGKLNNTQAVATDEPSGLPLSDGCDYFQFSTGKSVGEAADIFSELESLDQFLTQSSGGTKANASKKSHDKIEMDGLPTNKFTSDYVSNSGPDLLYALETAPVLPSNNNDTVGESGIPVPAPRIGDVTEEEGPFPDLETEDIVTSGHLKGKFKPKTRSQRGAKKTSASVPHPAADESVMDPTIVQFVPSETECVEEGSVPVPQPGDVVDHLSVNLGDCTMPDASMHEIPTNEELGNLPEASNDDAAPSEDVPRMPEKVSSKKGRKNASTASNLSKKSKKNATAANNEHEDESYNDGSINDEVPTCSIAYDGEDDDGDEDHMDSTSTRKRATRKSRKPVVKNEKLAQKRKKSTKELDQPAKEPPKKFPHSTRRKRRCVDKALLEDDDIDFQRIAIKDLILLAEHKEKLEKKEAKASSVPLANQSTQNSSHVEDAHNEESSFASEQAQESTDDPIGYTTQLNSCFLNYQSYMSKESRARWSKQDTELFYEAIRQFGTDMSMIQQLFPGRTRHQIKLKFKNEERRHPMRISEAVASRAKDHSHFEKVIKQLKQVNAQAKRGSDGDDSIGVMGEEEVGELAPDINGEATKTKKDEDVELEDQGADVAEVHSPLKSDECEDDADMWDSYKNAF